MPIFEHCVGTGFDLSSEFYGGKDDIMGGTGQGNTFSGSLWKDVSCFEFRSLENKKFGIVLQ